MTGKDKSSILQYIMIKTLKRCLIYLSFNYNCAVHCFLFYSLYFFLFITYNYNVIEYLGGIQLQIEIQPIKDDFLIVNNLKIYNYFNFKNESLGLPNCLFHFGN